MEGGTKRTEKVVEKGKSVIKERVGKREWGWDGCFNSGLIEGFIAKPLDPIKRNICPGRHLSSSRTESVVRGGPCDVSELPMVCPHTKTQVLRETEKKEGQKKIHKTYI